MSPPRILEHDLRTLSTVYRWGTVRSVYRQNVAEHSFYVAIYATQVADMVGWKGDRRELLEWALAHDVDEEFSGDIQGPTKRAAVDPERMKAFIAREADRRHGSFLHVYMTCPDGVNPDVRAIVKVADLLEEAMFLATEMSMGNGALEQVFNENVMPRVKAAWMGLKTTWGITDREAIEPMWRDEVLPQITSMMEGYIRPMLNEGNT